MHHDNEQVIGFSIYGKNDCLIVKIGKTDLSEDH